MKPLSGSALQPSRRNPSGRPTTLNLCPGDAIAGDALRYRKLEARLRREVARSIEETFGKD